MFTIYLSNQINKTQSQLTLIRESHRLLKLSKNQQIIRFKQQKTTVMQTNNQTHKSFYPTFNQNKPFQQRPQTPLGSTQNHLHNASLNRSLTKLNSLGYAVPPSSYNNPQSRNNIAHSRVSMSNSQPSHLSDLVNEPNIFPEQLVFLLRNEQKNINNIKEKILKQKSRVENDFAVFRTEIDHILQDVKLSVQAELDLLYKSYITKYAELKGEVQDLRLMRKQILMSSQTTYSPVNANNSASNKDLIHQIEKDAEYMRNFRIYGYLGELQKQKLQPINQIANQLVLMGAAQCPYYKHKQMISKFKTVKHNFGGTVKEVFDSLHQYVITPAYLIERERAQIQNTRTVLRELQTGDSTKMKPFDIHFPSNAQWQDRSTKDLKASKQPKRQNKIACVSPNQQGCATRWCEDVKLKRIEKVQTDHLDSILCIHFVGDKFLATGSKDNTINLYTLDGKKYKNLRGHQAAICCLAYVRGPSGDLLASGSDNGCGSIFLWDTKSWQVSSKIKAHEAAVTSILDLQDGRHIATGSYDKKINIFSMIRNQIVLSLNNKSPVTGLIMNSDRSHLIASGLDKSISVWSIIRKNNTIQDVIIEKIISCEELVCQLQPSLLRPDIVFCACRDGTLRILNIFSGQVEKSYTVNANSLIELVSIQREMNTESPLLISCSSKDNSLVLTKMDSGMSSLIKVTGGIGIDYGCGIGPKIVLSSVREGLMAILSQRKDNRQFSLFELQLK